MTGGGAAGRGRVAVCRVEATVADAVERAMTLAGWTRHVPEGARVALKPNLCWDLPLPGAQTSPWVLDAVITVLATRAAEIVVVEAGQIAVDVDAALERSGLGRVVRERGLEFVNMSRGRFVEARLEGAHVLTDASVPDVLAGRVLVSVPVLKTHGLTTISGALKNQWGCLPETRYRYHPVIDEAIGELNAILRPSFAVLDGTIALAGSGPKTGRPRVVDLVMASADLVALDSVAARVVGLDPEGIAHIRHASRLGLGTSLGIEIVGDEPSPVPGFRAPSPNLVARLEAAVRRSPLAGPAFDTPVVGLLAGGARAFNAAWWLLAGSIRRRRVIARTRYGPQWRGIAERDASGTRRRG